MKRLFCVLAVLVLMLASCTEVYRYTSDTFFAMNTVVSTVVSQEIGEDNTRVILSDIEGRMSRTDDDSEISKLNDGREVTLSDDTLAVLEKSLQVAKDTDYAFNPCMGALTDLWDITSGANVVPTQEEIEAALSFCDASQVEITADGVKMPKGMKIDLGGVAKGYALGVASEYLDETAMGRGVGADFCISLGGNVSVMGTSESRKNSGEKGWSVGITNPFDKGEIMGMLTLARGYVSVSGAYERFFEKDGRIYHHIFDGSTGYPAESDLASVVVVCDDGLVADALSTALFVMGKERAVEFCKSGKYDFELLLVCEDAKVLVSEGIAQAFTVCEDAYNINAENVDIIRKQM